MDSFSKIILLGFNILLLTQAQSLAQPSPKCSPLITAIQYCTHSIKTILGNWDTLAMCGDAAEKGSAGCDDNLAVRIIDHQANAYKITQKFFTGGSYSSDLVKDNDCLEMVSSVLDKWVQFTSGFLTDKGCRYFKTRVFTAVSSVGNTKCDPMIQDYIETLYSATSCVKVVVNIPTKEDAKNLEDVFTNYESCLTSHQIECNSGKSERLGCVEDMTSHKISNPSLKYVEKNMVDIVGNTDKVFCEDANLRKEFDAVSSCYDYVNRLNNLLLNQVNGFHTEEGCEGLKYIDHFTVGVFGGSCRPVLQKYLGKLKSRLPCVAGGEQGNSSYGVNTCEASVLLIVSAMFAVIFKS